MTFLRTLVQTQTARAKHPYLFLSAPLRDPRPFSLVISCRLLLRHFDAAFFAVPRTEPTPHPLIPLALRSFCCGWVRELPTQAFLRRHERLNCCAYLVSRFSTNQAPRLQEARTDPKVHPTASLAEPQAASSLLSTLLASTLSLTLQQPTPPLGIPSLTHSAGLLDCLCPSRTAIVGASLRTTALGPHTATVSSSSAG